jgi:two-component system, NarL family, invasion response regulator UvrY
LNLRALIADNQALTSAGLTHILSDLSHVSLQGQVLNSMQLFSALKTNRPDFLFIDYKSLLDFKIEYFSTIINNYPETRILVISSDSDQESILRILDSGVPGFLTKECSQEEIRSAISALEKCEKFFCHKILDIVMKSRLSRKKASHSTFLSERELEIIKLISLGNSTLQIAANLNLSHHTVSSHRKNIIRKLSIKSPTEFVVHAIDLGLINLEPKK